MRILKFAEYTMSTLSSVPKVNSLPSAVNDFDELCKVSRTSYGDYGSNFTLRHRNNLSEKNWSDDPNCLVGEQSPYLTEDEDSYLFENKSNHTSSGTLSTDKLLPYDVSFFCEGNKCHAHKSVLSAATPYFKAMFTLDLAESKQNVITIPEIEADIFKSLIEYIYHDKILISESNVLSLLQAGDRFGILSLKEACAKFIEARVLDENNCFWLYSFADLYGCQNLKEDAKFIAANSFKYINNQEDFLCLSTPLLEELIKEESLLVDFEEELFDAVMRWLQHDNTSRFTNLYRLLEHVRLPVDSPKFTPRIRLDITPLFTPTKLKSVVHAQTVQLKKGGQYIWDTPLEDTIMVGGGNNISVVRPDCSVTTHLLKLGTVLFSAVCVNTQVTVVHIKYDLGPMETEIECKPDSIYTVNLNVKSTLNTVLPPINRLHATNPVCLFVFSKYKYGVLCVNHNRIKVFKMRDILSKRFVEPIDTIDLEIPQIGFQDKVCVNSKSQICVCSRQDRIVYVCNNRGKILFTLGQGRINVGHVVPGLLSAPVGIQSGETDAMLISCWDGDVYSYRNGKLGILKNVGGYISHNVFTRNRLWTIYGGTVNMYYCI